MAIFHYDDKVHIKSLDKIGYIFDFDKTDNSYGVWIPVEGKPYGELEFFSENNLEKIEENENVY